MFLVLRVTTYYHQLCCKHHWPQSSDVPPKFPRQTCTPPVHTVQGGAGPGSEQHMRYYHTKAYEISTNKHILSHILSCVHRALLALEVSKVQNYPFTDSQQVSAADWEAYVSEIAGNMMQEQSPKQLYLVGPWTLPAMVWGIVWVWFGVAGAQGLLLVLARPPTRACAMLRNLQSTGHRCSSACLCAGAARLSTCA